MNWSVSPSRTYVAVCCKINFKGYYFMKFVLPEQYTLYDAERTPVKLENNSTNANWYFLNRLDITACIEGCITFEDYCNIKDVTDLYTTEKKRNSDTIVSKSLADKFAKSVAEINTSTKEFVEELNKNFNKELEELEKEQWEHALEHLNVVTKAYTSLVGIPNVNAILAIAHLDSLLKRYYSGERTEELYNAIKSCE